MADLGISGVINNLVSGFTQVRNASGIDPTVSGPSQSGGVRRQSTFRSNPLLPQQHVNIDGVTFDLNAPRGTYVNIVV
ncbi:MAG TPA: hypothetical protein VK558_16820 [Patescibacteria group bacterium]|nr:hypothetical protein [Patescibacteria group bacterium]